ncbi:PaaI family thioesterase [Parvicella tangerina]|uniref:Acyl-coenzyme A thioesterase PaaI n=1 Tax=Parvicella tangerina TaxID=2829795 RepID=A0A916JN18_9FLAO|nr:hotdog fold thioesterase [Parvicella tangerina]CAG5081960.1 Acyl-coenzyme A thioesterase PaaI [Parvicella tangerina]
MTLKPSDIVQRMMDSDSMSQWLGIKVLEVEIDHCKLQMTVREDMVNGFNIAHGGITYSLADSCVAFAANTNGSIAVSVESSISHLQKVMINDVLTARAELISKNAKMGTYQVVVTNQNNDKVAHFKGVMYFTKRNH